jgi:hypothetical protein
MFLFFCFQTEKIHEAKLGNQFVLDTHLKLAVEAEGGGPDVDIMRVKTRLVVQLHLFSIDGFQLFVTKNPIDAFVSNAFAQTIIKSEFQGIYAMVFEAKMILDRNV